MTDDKLYAPDPGPADMRRMQRLANQADFLREHLDLIVPFRFTVPQHVARRQGRLLKTWGETTLRLREVQK